MRVGVVGAGVVGLATAASLLRAGVAVVCFEQAPVVMGERSAGSSRIFRLAHTDPDLVRLAAAARAGFARWASDAGTPMVDPVGCVVTGDDTVERAAAMAEAGAVAELADTLPADRWLPAAGPLAGPVLVDPAGGVVDVDAVRALLTARAGAVVVRERVDGLDGARLHTASGEYAYDAVVLAAGAGTAALASGAGIDLPAALEHHARFTFPMTEPPGARAAAWIDNPPDGLPTYQHRTGPGRWAVGGTVDAARVAWENGRDAAIEASREAVLAHARARLTVEPAVVESLYCTHAPATGDGIVFRRNGPVLAVWGENLMKFAPVLGEVLAAAAVAGSTPSVSALGAAGDMAGSRDRLIAGRANIAVPTDGWTTQAMTEVPRTVQLYDLSRQRIMSEMPYFGDIMFMDGDEMEIESVGAFKIIGRRWSLSGASIVLILLLEPLA